MTSVSHAHPQVEPSGGTAASARAGQIASALVVLFMIVDGAMKVLRSTIAVEGTMQLGYPEADVVTIGALALVSTAVYAVPRTAMLGAILLTAYLGGATASQVRVEADLFPVLFPGMLGVLLWGGIFLRDARLRAFLPLRR